MNDQGNDQKNDFSTLDVTFIRVLEDLIAALLEKGELRLTDLPVAAQEKLRQARDKGLRRRRNHDLDLLDDDENLL